MPAGIEGLRAYIKLHFSTRIGEMYAVPGSGYYCILNNLSRPSALEAQTTAGRPGESANFRTATALGQ